MKSFVISIILFVLMAVTIAGNSIYINNVTNTLSSMTDELTDITAYSEKIDIISDYWNSHIDLISISVNFHETEMITEAILTLRAYSLTPDSPEFKYAKAKLSESLKEMRLGEKISISNIL